MPPFAIFKTIENFILGEKKSKDHWKKYQKSKDHWKKYQKKNNNV